MCFVSGHHFGGLLDTAAANTIVEKKIDSVLAGPEGYITLTHSPDSHTNSLTNSL